jgi:hypothetical protein
MLRDLETVAPSAFELVLFASGDGDGIAGGARRLCVCDALREGNTCAVLLVLLVLLGDGALAARRHLEVGGGV